MSGIPKPGSEKRRIPAHSVFYNRVIPALLLGMALATVIFIGVAVGVLLGFVPYQ